MRQRPVRGLLVDIDGTLLVHDRPVPGAAEALARWTARGVPYRLVTNTTRRSRAATASVLRAAGLDVDPADVLMVGDDVTLDARGGADAGCRTALVRTGTFQGSREELAGFEPDLVVDSVADLSP
jgi:ribonucleotide monophosphatase NagD (HAD superfamily)